MYNFDYKLIIKIVGLKLYKFLFVFEVGIYRVKIRNNVVKVIGEVSLKNLLKWIWWKFSNNGGFCVMKG